MRSGFPVLSLVKVMKTRCVVPYWLVGIVLGFVAGCSGGEDGRLKVHPTTGSVLVNGQPVAGAQVTLLGLAEELKGPLAPIPFGTTNDQGEFVLRSYDPGDGAPAGDYQVKIVWPENPPPGADTEMYQAKDQLKGRYSDPAKSGLTATIAQGKNSLPPFELRQ